MSAREKQKKPNKSLLYRVVYESRPVFLVTVLLVATFLIQPVLRVEASEVLESAPVSDVAVDHSQLTTTTDIPLPPARTEVVEVSVTSPELSDEPLVLPPGSPEEVGLEVVSTTTPIINEALISEVVLSTSTTSTTTSEVDSSGGLVGSSTPAVSEVVSTGDEDVEEMLPSVPAPDSETPVISPGTTTESVSEMASTTMATTAEPVLPLVHESYSDAEVRFLKQDCVTVDGGAYYCQVRTPGGSPKDALIAEPDSGGDLEIFLVKDGAYHQLTFNDVDDAAPYYDGRSETMVWHRLVGDAYVIYEYDFTTGEERALSRGLDNDMEPSRFGDRTVWQRWVDGRWQVILHEDDVETLLTTADAHHLAPVIRGEIIMWQTVDGTGEKQIETLDLLTGRYNSINDAESAALANPRMMMVYEAVYENGDVITRGVDLKTGEVVALDALPAELPDELPESDSTGEPRALVQPKPAQKDGEAEIEDDNLLPMPSPGATTTDSFTLDLTPAGLVSTSSATSSLPLATTDLVIEPLVLDVVATTTE